MADCGLTPEANRDFDPLALGTNHKEAGNGISIESSIADNSRSTTSASAWSYTQFALVDAALEDAIREMLGLERHQAAFLMPQLRHEQKRNMFLALLEKVNVTEERRLNVVKLIEKIETKSRLRNYIAHSVWTKGRKPNSIKPMSITAKKKLKLLGFEHNEKEYTAKELERAAYEIGETYDQLKAFIESGGDFVNS